MSLSQDHLELLRSISEEWNRAERDIKLAEQICENIVIPSVKELRYAGRRLVDAIQECCNGKDQAQISRFLEDARFNCHKARHDAIDAATSKMAIDLDAAVQRLDYDAILPAFSQFPTLLDQLNELRSAIAASRENRENREKIYADIESVDFPALVTTFRKFQSSEPIMVRLASKSRSNLVYAIGGLVFGVVGVLIGIVGIAIAIWQSGPTRQQPDEANPAGIASPAPEPK